MSIMNAQTCSGAPGVDCYTQDITDHALQTKRSLAYEAFRTALEDRLKKEGKLQLMPDKMKSFGTSI
jgi:hypothetical protein